MFGRRSIRNKLAIALWGAAIMAFAAAGLALALFEDLTLERRVGQIMEPYAQLVSVGTEAAVAFEDPGRAQEILNTLRTNPQISLAEIILRDGRLLARYGSRSRATALPVSLKPDGVYLNHDNAELMQSLQDGAHLRLVMSLNELNRQTRNVLWVFTAGVLVLLVAITLGLRAALQKTIISPISTLVETVEQVRTRADYSRRVPASGVDEVARLGQSFNAMMGVIQEREDDLRRLTLFQRTILDNAAYGIISTTTEGIVSSFNRAAERMLGYTADEVVGKLTPVCWHDQEEIARRALQLSEELGETVAPGFEVFAVRLRHNLPEENEWSYIRKDGTRAPMFLSVTALREDSGRITGLLGLIYDLTERKRAE
ncbi:MAG TPA: hybrid sensor histidine kinase/response regulator, partial [Geobacter sp.]|nr:hybrid sensor histidine kinase/response regulator [Geobacter sp.]